MNESNVYQPLNEYRQLWQKIVKVNLGEQDELKSGKNILIGIIKNLKVCTSLNGDNMAFASLIDFNGEINLIFFPKTWVRYEDKINEGDIVALKGKIDINNSNKNRSFIASKMLDIDRLLKKSFLGKSRKRGYK